MNGLDLFSGIGGLSIALSKWVKTVAYCERDRYAQAVLLSRMQDGALDRAPIWDDVRALRGETLPTIDIIFGGFPCQDISTAGRGAGLAGEQSGLFFELLRLVKEVKPSFVFLENVPAIRTRGLLTIVDEFTKVGYDCRWTCLTAKSVGAPHRRERWFLLAYSVCKGLEGFRELREVIETEGEAQRLTTDGSKQSRKTWWESEPSVCRVVNGVPNWVDRIKCLGNAVVPQQAEEAFIKLLKLQ